MTIYRVRFLKRISDDTGHEHQTCQCAFNVEAESSETAVSTAQKLFQSNYRSSDWRFHADRIEVEPVEQASEMAERPRSRASR